MNYFTKNIEFSSLNTKVNLRILSQSILQVSSQHARRDEKRDSLFKINSLYA